MTFRVLDDKNRTLREGKDLAALKGQLQEKVQETLSAVADAPFPVEMQQSDPLARPG